MKDCYIVIPVFTDPFLHPLHKNNKLSFLYVREIEFNPSKLGETRIISELNPDCTEMCEDYSFISKKEGLTITPDSKILQAILPEHRNVLDQYAGGSSLGGFLVTMVLISFLCNNKRG